MRYYLAVVAALIATQVSASSIEHIEYKFDPKRHQRAQKFYKELALTQIENFDASEQTQFVLNKIGGLVCQAFDKFAVFDFKKFDKFQVETDKAYALQVVEPADSKPDESMPKMSMIYKVCGKDFDPLEKKDLLSTFKHKEIVSDKYASCGKMGSNSDTNGNVYLVSDGKCVQSFSMGDFAAKVEKKTEKGSETAVIKQSWTLKYTSKQECYKDSKKKFEIEIQGKCLKEGDATMKKIAGGDDCKILLEYAAKGACYIQYVPIMQYLNMVAPYFGAIFIAIGLTMCFHGSKLIVYMIAMLIGLGITGFAFMIGYNFLNQETTDMMHFIILLVVAIIFGIVGSIAAYFLVKDWAIPVLAFWLGIAVAMMILKLTQVQDQKITLLAAAVGGVIGVVLGKKMNVAIKQIGTAVIGSFIVIRGVAMYIGNYPSEFETGDAKALTDKSGEMLYYTLGYFACFIVLSCVGTWYQRKNYPDEAKEGDEMDNEDEAKICGMF